MVLPIWRDFLWPSRTSEIKEISSISRGGSIEMDIYEFKDSAQFWACFHGPLIVGVNSVFLTSLKECRSRGLWVHTNYRGRKLGHRLLEKALEYGQENHCELLWSLPRKSSFHVYQAFGFKQVSPWSHKGMEFGPNCLAELKI